MGFHGFDGEPQPVRGFARGLAPADEAEHLQFPVAQPLDGVVSLGDRIGTASWPAEGLGQRLAHIAVAREHPAQGDEKLVGRGSVALQATLEALAFAANKAASLGRPLRAGAYISTGMITGVHDILVGQGALLSFEGCGELRCRMIAAEPLAAMRQPA